MTTQTLLTIPATCGSCLGCLDRPTEKAALAALTELLGPRPAEDLWNLAVRAVGLRRPVDETDDLRRVADYLMEIANLARIAGRSLKVRIITCQALMGDV